MHMMLHVVFATYIFIWCYTPQVRIYIYTSRVFNCVIEFGVASSEKFRARFITHLQAICVASVNFLVFYAN